MPDSDYFKQPSQWNKEAQRKSSLKYYNKNKDVINARAKVRNSKLRAERNEYQREYNKKILQETGDATIHQYRERLGALQLPEYSLMEKSEEEEEKFKKLKRQCLNLKLYGNINGN